MGENLYKKVKNKLDNVNPIVNYNDVLDNNGESIKDKFNKLNHIFLDFKDNSVAKTRLQLPIERRRKGLYVSYVNSSGDCITEQYIGEDCTDSYFALNKNWSRLDSIKTDSNGKILSSYLPSYVDDVLEYDSLDKFPKIGEGGKIYVTLDTDLTYRWSGSKYTEISKSLALGETETTAFPGNRGVILENNVNNIFNSITNINNSIDNVVTDINDVVADTDNKFNEVYSTISNIPQRILPIVILNPENETEIEQNKREFSKVERTTLCWVLLEGRYYEGILLKDSDRYNVYYRAVISESKHSANQTRTLETYCRKYRFNTDGTPIKEGHSFVSLPKYTDYIGLRCIECSRGRVYFYYENSIIPNFELTQNDFIYDADVWRVGDNYHMGYISYASSEDTPQICSSTIGIGAIFPKKVGIETNDIALFNITDEDRIHVILKKYIPEGDSSEVYKEYDLATKDDLETIKDNLENSLNDGIDSLKDNLEVTKGMLPILYYGFNPGEHPEYNEQNRKIKESKPNCVILFDVINNTRELCFKYENTSGVFEYRGLSDSNTIGFLGSYVYTFNENIDYTLFKVRGHSAGYTDYKINSERYQGSILLSANAFYGDNSKSIEITQHALFPKISNIDLVTGLYSSYGSNNVNKYPFIVYDNNLIGTHFKEENITAILHITENNKLTLRTINNETKDIIDDSIIITRSELNKIIEKNSAIKSLDVEDE